MPIEPKPAKPVRKPRPTARRKSGWNAMLSWVHRQSRTAKALIAVITAIAAVLGFVTASFAFDDRYAKNAVVQNAIQNLTLVQAADVKSLRDSQERYALEHVIAVQKSRRSYVADQMYALRGKGRLAPHEQQALMRFNAEYEELSKDVEAKQRLADRLRAGGR